LNRDDPDINQMAEDNDFWIRYSESLLESKIWTVLPHPRALFAQVSFGGR